VDVTASQPRDTPFALWSSIVAKKKMVVIKKGKKKKKSKLVQYSLVSGEIQIVQVHNTTGSPPGGHPVPIGYPVPVYMRVQIVNINANNVKFVYGTVITMDDYNNPAYGLTDEGYIPSWVDSLLTREGPTYTYWNGYVKSWIPTTGTTGKALAWFVAAVDRDEVNAVGA
jgi:hypothetical protein